MNLLHLFCSTQGRVGRGLYWSIFGLWLLVSFALRGSVSAVASFSGNEQLVAIFFWAWVGFGIVTYFPMTALLVKRLHDVGRSGLWTLFQHLFLLALMMMLAALARMSGGSIFAWLMVLLVCGLGMFVVFVFTLLGSEDGSNEFGMSS